MVESPIVTFNDTDYTWMIDEILDKYFSRIEEDIDYTELKHEILNHPHHNTILSLLNEYYELAHSGTTPERLNKITGLLLKLESPLVPL